MKDSAIRLVAFDLDGTLLRHQTVAKCWQAKSAPVKRMQQFELLHQSEDTRQAIKEMAGWYRSWSRTQLCTFLQKAHFAPGVCEAMALLNSTASICIDLDSPGSLLSHGLLRSGESSILWGHAFLSQARLPTSGPRTKPPG